jgi:hypothetical protein
MAAAEVGMTGQSHDAQRLGDGALARRQDGAADQHQDMVSDRRGEARAALCPRNAATDATHSTMPPSVRRSLACGRAAQMVVSKCYTGRCESKTLDLHGTIRTNCSADRRRPTLRRPRRYFLVMT